MTDNQQMMYVKFTEDYKDYKAGEVVYLDSDAAAEIPQKCVNVYFPVDGKKHENGQVISEKTTKKAKSTQGIQIEWLIDTGFYKKGDIVGASKKDAEEILAIEGPDSIRIIENGVQGGKDKPKITYTDEQVKEAIKRFKDPDVLKNILLVLSEDHIGDDNLKMTTFATDVSGLLPDPKLRKSIALKGDSSVGKDNLIKTCLKHMPLNSYKFLTSGTQASIEDDLKNVRIIAFSEMNSNREGGANKFLVEVIKQKAEGGTSSMKKDIRKGMKESRHDEGEQATINYGTTESESDEELGTRFICGTIMKDPAKIKRVNDHTLDSFSDKESLISQSDVQDSWIRIGLTIFYESPDQYKIILPFASFLKESVNGKDVFDHSDPRSQRDLKRILALTCATVYLRQLQRKIETYNGQKLLVGEISDLIDTLSYSEEFFNQSYTGIDARLSKVLELFDEFGTGWVARDLLQEKLGVTRNTIKGYCKTLGSEGCLEGIKGSQLNEPLTSKLYDSNKIYYRRYQKGIKRPLIRCELSELREFLEKREKEELTSSSIDDNPVYEGVVSKNNKTSESDEIIPHSDEKGAVSDEIDTLNLTPSPPVPIPKFNPKRVEVS